MRLPSSLSPLSLLALGWGLSAPVTALAANTPDLRPGVIRSTAALGPARVLTGAEVEKARLATGIDRAASGTYALATGAGHVFHRTTQPIHALKTLDVPRASVQLHTWQEETADGRRQDYFAYSQGGVALLGRVQATEYLVRLEHARFDPLKGAQPLVAGLLTADASNTLHLVQFHATPLPEYRDAIQAAGGKVLRFLTDHTFLVEMNASTHKRVAGLPYVRWVGAYHPEYRVEGVLRESLQGRALKLEPQRYSIMVGERGAARQGEVASLVRALGGTVELIEAGGLRVEATLTQSQLERLVRSNAVQYVDRWGGPGELDNNNVRQVGGATYLEGLEGFTGQGVRGEIFDTELRTTHQEWATAPIIHSTGTTGGFHGSACYSINFARGVDGNARGLIPSGQGIFFRYNESSQFGGPKSRYDINRELIDPAGQYRAVFQTSSVGSAQVTGYTTISAEVDDYLFQYPILSTQSQSNTGNRNSRPQAWAKNIVSVGGMYHYDNTNRADDRWNGGASVGPAADGRLKPDLSYYYDSIRSASNSSNTSYTNFGGTSAATPQTAGHFGLLFQMWHEGVWAGFGGGADVFASRPKMATAKALMINMAHRYNWLAGGSNGDLTRARQGWGTADVKRLYDRAEVTSIINETDRLLPLGTNTYRVNVGAGEKELNVTMVYTDPAGTVGAAQARINDLSLRVTSPTGVVYWGNNGLTAGNVSTAGGVSNTVDTVENVFLTTPAAGTWTVEVIGDEIVQDTDLSTRVVDANYALVVSGGKIQ
ncbi:S8 family serine peptidase [Myxococcus vastator]|uniref:S8 family serine peptidase n=1 Tax=Myxococcus vastator TaxID=2709664 RepID=UPI0013D5BE43|nr:S8 family serine peptidase [Myxococcus vastator]